MTDSKMKSADLKNMTHNLDLRGIACPLNFVKTKLFMDKLQAGDILEVCLDAGEPVESVYASIQAEGHKVNSPEQNSDGTFILHIEKMASFLLFLVVCIYLQFCCSAAQAALGGNSLPTTVNDKNSEEPISVEEQIRLAKEAAALAPTDIAKHLQLARLLRKSGNTKQAAIEYLNISVINPANQVAYHEMLLCKPSIGQIDEAIARINKLEENKSKQLLTKMVLSELYERKEDYYQAARVLVDLQYSQTIPQKYVAQISSRIHMLLGKTKDVKTTEKAIEQKSNVEEEEFNPSTPLPMPDAALTKETSFEKLRNTKKVREGYGHAQLSP